MQRGERERVPVSVMRTERERERICYTYIGIAERVCCNSHGNLPTSKQPPPGTLCQILQVLFLFFFILYLIISKEQPHVHLSRGYTCLVKIKASGDALILCIYFVGWKYICYFCFFWFVDISNEFWEF